MMRTQHSQALPPSSASPDAGKTASDRAGATEPDRPETADPDRSEAFARLAALRGSIDNIDAALIHMLAERFRCTQAVGELKARSAMPPGDPAREAQQVARLRALAREARLDPDFAEKFLAFVIREVIRHHEAIAQQQQQQQQCHDPGAAGG